MASCPIVYVLLLAGFECLLGVRPDTLESPLLVAGVKGHDGDTGVLAVNHRGIILRNTTAPHGSHIPHLGVSSPAGLLEMLQSAAPVMPKKPSSASGSLQPHDVLVFYGILYTVGLLIFLCFRYLEPVKINCSRLLRQVAVFYWRWSRLAPIGGSCCLYLLADVLATAGGQGEDRGQLCWKAALLVSSALFNAIWHNRFYAWLDSKVDGGEGLRGRLKQAATMSVFHLVIYLPLAVPFFLIIADFFNRTFNDAVANCTTSALAAIPKHIGDSTSLAAEQLAASYGWSVMFWPGSNAVNFSLVQSWSPGFRSTWDGIVAVLWNAYVLAAQRADPVAVGPMIADRNALTPDLKKQAPSMDCKKSSAVAIAYLIAEFIYYTIEYTYFFIRWVIFTSKTQSWLFGCYVKRHIWEAWCVFCYICRNLYMLSWTLVSWCCTIVWRILMVPFQLFDQIKWYIGMFFVPRMWDYDKCPCPKAAFDSSWTTPGVIYTGTLFGK